MLHVFCHFIEKYILISMNLAILYNRCCQLPGEKPLDPTEGLSAPTDPQFDAPPSVKSLVTPDQCPALGYDSRLVGAFSDDLQFGQ